MSIYRGAGGSGDATADSSSEALLIRELAVEVQADADAAAASAAAASTSAGGASTSATNAASSATSAASSSTSAASSASSAASSASAAATSASNAATSATAAQTAETNAETAETNAAASATSAAGSATTATTQATNASNSASAAATSATNASNSASAAATSATNAGASATSAAGSASAASTSASSASTSATNAAASETSAASSASAASTSATNAASSATSAAGSATTATTQAGLAATSATNAATSETNAAASASAASTSASNAATSASAAATSATNAANSATLAASYTPSQTGNAGKFLTTDGTNTSWDALATVANSGSYNDLSDKPTIPTNLDSLTDVTVTSPTTDQVLKYNGSSWVNEAAASSYNGMKNRIINGAMMIDQRNAGASVTPTATQYTLDRWNYFCGGVASKFSIQQNAGSVTPPVGFKNYLGMTSLSAYSVSATDRFGIQQSIEGYNVADLGWGTASAKTVTLSAWVYSSLTGTFGGAVQNDAANRTYPFTYSIPVANTWTQISVTIAGDTSGTWLSTNGAGIVLYFGAGVGSTYSGTAGSWAGANYFSATGATSVVGTSGATFYITGVQLEVGSSATGFEYRQYQQELALCRRYLPAFTGQYNQFGAYAYATTGAQATIPFDVPARVAPTGITVSSASHFTFTANANYVASAVSLNTAGVNGAGILLTISGATLGQGGAVFGNSTSSQLLFVGCEL